MKELTTNAYFKDDEAEEGKSRKQIKGEDVFVAFMGKVINESSEKLDEYFAVFMQDWIASKAMRDIGWVNGVSKFIQQLEGFVEDLPILPKLFGEKVVVPLMKAGQISLRDIKWAPTDEEDKEFLYNVTGHYRVAALILEYQFTQLGEEQIKSGFKKEAGEEFAFFKKKLSEAGDGDALIEHIKSDIKSD